MRRLPPFLPLLLLAAAPAAAETLAPDAAPVAADAPVEPGPAVRPPTAPAAALGWTDQTPIATILQALGAPAPAHARPTDPALVETGREIFTTGRAVGPDGKKAKKQSRAFECTDCHNAVREDPDLRASDPATRLDYAEAWGLSFLPGTTMYGQVDRSSWFNGDYVKKYGALVEPANNSLMEAIQLCSVECSQGRALSDWEMEAMLAFLGSLGLRWADLDAAELDLAQIEAAASGTDEERDAARGSVQAAFLPASPATFVDEPEAHGKDEAGYGLTGDPARGEAVYKRACLHCHGRGGPSVYRLADRRGRYRELRQNQGKRDQWSYYVAVRHGTSPFSGRYMPGFTQERLSDQQVEDLRAWIDQNAAPKGRR